MTDWLVTGAGGALGSVLMRLSSEQHVDAYGVISPHGPAPHIGRVLRLDLSDADLYRERILSLAPRVIVHLAAVSQPAEAYRDPERARAVNVDATAQLVEVAALLGARLLYASTDLVFDGESAPYDEHATTEPLSFYGRTKLEAECHVLAYRRGLALRFPLMYGLPEAPRAPGFFAQLVAALRAGQPMRLFADEYRTPLWLEDAARVCLKLAATELRGVIHVGGPERLSRFEMGQRVAAALAAPGELVIPASRSELQAPEPRARDVSLANTRYAKLFGEPVGQSMAECLPRALSGGPHRRLS